ncbi:hypothetical protein HID58_048269, partial [Brassica napus]
FLQIHLRLSSLILGSGDTFYTAIASFCLRETHRFRRLSLPGSSGSDSTVLSPASSLIVPESVSNLHLWSSSAQSTLDLRIHSTIVLASMVVFGHTFSLTPAEDDVTFRAAIEVACRWSEGASIVGHVPLKWCFGQDVAAL